MNAKNILIINAILIAALIAHEQVEAFDFLNVYDYVDFIINKIDIADTRKIEQAFDAQVVKNDESEVKHVETGINDEEVLPENDSKSDESGSSESESETGSNSEPLDDQEENKKPVVDVEAIENGNIETSDKPVLEDKKLATTEETAIDVNEGEKENTSTTQNTSSLTAASKTETGTGKKIPEKQTETSQPSSSTEESKEWSTLFYVSVIGSSALVIALAVLGYFQFMKSEDSVEL